MIDNPLIKLDSQRIGPYLTKVRFKPKRKKGHFDIDLFLDNEKGYRSQLPLVTGIYSRGNVSQNIQTWMDIHYSDQVKFDDHDPDILSQSDRCAEDVFEMIGKVIEPGGMIFVSLVTDIAWEIDSELHRITRRCVDVRSLEIPMAATPLGRLVFFSGCLNIKSQAFDVQGSSRIAGEKALNQDIKKDFLNGIQKELRKFLKRKKQKRWTRIYDRCRLNAKDVLNRLCDS